MSVDTSKFISLGGLVNFKTRQDVVNDEKLLKRQDISVDENEIQIAISEQNVLRALTSNSTIQANKVSGVIDIEHIPEATLERIVQVANQAARYALTPSQVQEGDVVQEQDTGLMFFVMDSTKLSQAAGYQEFTAGAASSVPWSGVTDKPDAFTPSSHTHGNISNDGKIGSTGNLPVITGTDGIVQTGSFGNAANTFCEGNDSRLSDSRDPNDHASNKVTLMTGYSIPASTSAISALDSLNAAVGKLEKKEDNISAVSGSMADYAMAEETGAVSTADQVVEALGKIEYKANYFALPEELDEYLFGIVNRITLVDAVVAQKTGSDQRNCLIHLYFSEGVEASGEVDIENVMLSTNESSFTVSNVYGDLSKRQEFVGSGHVVFEVEKEIVYTSSDLWIKIPSNYFKRKSDSSLVAYDIILKVVEPPRNGEIKLKSISFETSNDRVWLFFYKDFTRTSSDDRYQYKDMVRYSYDNGATYVVGSDGKEFGVGLWSNADVFINGINYRENFYLKIPENIGFKDVESGNIISNPELILRIPSYY